MASLYEPTQAAQGRDKKGSSRDQQGGVMHSLKQYFSRPLTLREMGVAVLLLAVAAGLFYAAYSFAAAKILDARVEKALPAVCAAIRQQRRAILNALEAYKVQFGAYPPDHLISRQPTIVDPITNTLLYELAGVLYDPTSRKLQVAGLEPAEEDYVTNFFHCQRFKNWSQSRDQLKAFLSKNDSVSQQLHDDPDVFALSAAVDFSTIPQQLYWEINAGSWRYVSSAPTNNPGKFDLWVEIRHKDHTITLGNWKQVE
jgi:hypothetical protein